MHRLLLGSVLLLCTIPSLLSAAAEPDAGFLGGTVWRVGVGTGCDFTTIGTALSVAGEGDTIRVRSGSYNELVSMGGRSVRLVGGYAECTSPAPTGRSTIDRGGSGLGMDIFYAAADTDPERLIVVENFVIRRGGGSGDLTSGGVLVEGRPGLLEVNFRNVEISNNQRAGVGEDGGGLRVVTSGAGVQGRRTRFVSLDNASSVVNNTAADAGGGIHAICTAPPGAAISILEVGTALILQNSAQRGGGVAVSNCINVTLRSGGPVVLFPTAGIVNNTATVAGGGLWVGNASHVSVRSGLSPSDSQLGSNEDAALIAGNSAPEGGAAWIEGSGSVLDVIDAYVIDNTATVRGGAFRVTDGLLRLNRPTDAGRCDPEIANGVEIRRPPCSVVADNVSAGSGGAFSVSGGGEAIVRRTVIRGNDADGAGLTDGGGSVLKIDNTNAYAGAPTEVVFDANVIHDNLGPRPIEVLNNGLLTITDSTVADNPSPSFSLQDPGGRGSRIDLRRAIVDASPVWLTRSGVGITTLELDCVIGNLAQASTGADIASAYSQVDPRFVDRFERDYRLRDDSPAIDYCDGFAATGLPDHDGNLRGVAWNGPVAPPIAPNPGVGDYDLGAFEHSFQALPVDLQLRTQPPGQTQLFVGPGGRVDLTLVLGNLSANEAIGPIRVTGAFAGGSLTNRSWSCAPVPDVSCTPASGSGELDTVISGVSPGDQIFLFVDADLVDPNADQGFGYSAEAVGSDFNIDTNTANNRVDLEVQTGVFADGFESG